MRQLLFLHGAGAKPEDPPTERLRQGLPGWSIAAPDLGEPDAATWGDRIDAALATLPADGAVVGHSLGGSMLLKVIAERRPGRRLAAFVGLACPFWGEPGWEFESFYLPEGFAGALGGIGRIDLFQDPADEVVDRSHLAVWSRHLPAARTGWTPGTGHGFAGGDIGPVLAALAQA